MATPTAALVLDSPLGPLTVLSAPTGLTELRFGHAGQAVPAGDPHGAGPALVAWFAGALGALDGLPLAPDGTLFQRAVWDRLRAVPAGQTTTYGELARALGSVRKARAVGQASATNPLPIIVPCHRLVGRDDRLVGYTGGLEKKRWLLAHEGAPGFLVP
ncbi:MAG: methylated-DNA--[protein]-cysteine S-methyltransferase [Myxococcales bacterium]|nr:methylated-DNA--[protein]-cysteine S-methyltransferase [Myxococcales bacterium]MCB9522578.1 methylated-DNA--[protein]-cysteine S-methyltransferase [Myxococcales bacterium]